MRILGSITNRIFLASALLAMLSIGAAVYFVSARLTAQTEAELQNDLKEAATLVNDQRRSEFDSVARTARLIADLPKFKAVVEIADRPTLEPIAYDYQAQAGADLLMVTGRKGQQLAIVGDTTAKPMTADSSGLDRSPWSKRRLTRTVGIRVPHPSRAGPAPFSRDAASRTPSAARPWSRRLPRSRSIARPGMSG